MERASGRRTESAFRRGACLPGKAAPMGRKASGRGEVARPAKAAVLETPVISAYNWEMAVPEQPHPLEDQPKTGKREHLGPCAKPPEIMEHFRALAKDPVESTRLWEYARMQSRKFHGRTNDSIAHDLLVEALCRAVSGESSGSDDDEPSRHWYPQERSFPNFFRGSIQSISSSWRKQDKRFLVPRQRDDQAGHPDTQSVPEALRSPVDEEAKILKSIMLAKARDCLRSRPEALEIFDMLKAGYKRAEICERLGITEQDYANAFRWMKRAWEDEGYGSDRPTV
jgi:hypothetical protein